MNRQTLTSVLTQLQLRMCAAVEKIKPSFTSEDEVEIDEMWIDWEIYDKRTGPNVRKRKMIRGTWIIGVIDRKRSKLWIQPIRNRSKKSISAAIEPLFPQDSPETLKIFTDALSTYEYLERKHTHYVINKVKHGMGICKRVPNGRYISINVNTIENNWKLLRDHLTIRHAYSDKSRLFLHIGEFMFNWYELSLWDLLRIE